MAQYYTDFSGYTTGVAPSDWTARWVTSGVTYTVREESGATGGKCLRGVRASSGARSLLSWDAIDGDAGRATLDILVRVRASAQPSNTQVVGVTARASGSSGNESGYNALPLRTGLTLDGFVGISKYVSGTFTSGIFEEKSWTAGTWYWARIQYEGSAQRVRRWAGALGDEPGTWDATDTDTSLSSAGWVGLLFPSNGANIDVDVFAVGTGGDAAPYPPITGTASAVAPAATVAATNADGAVGTVQAVAPSATVQAAGYAGFPPQQYFTDFSAYTTGVAPSDWTARWVTSGVTYEVIEDASATGGKCLRGVRASSSGRSLITWDALDDDAGRATLEILVRVRASAQPENTSIFGVVGRASGAASSESGYAPTPIRTVITGPAIGHGAYVGGSFSLLTYQLQAWAVDTWYWARVQMVGTTIRTRRWAGALDEEPETWDISDTDASLSSAGWVGLLFPSTGVTIDVDLIGVGTAGASAPAFPPGGITGTVGAVAPAATVYATDALGTTGSVEAVAPAATVSAEGTTWPVLSAFELNGGTAWTSVSQLADFLAAVESAAGGRMAYSTAGTSVDGNPIHLVRVGAETPTKGTVLVVAQQHGNEPSGREAGLQVLRNLALTDDADTIAYLQDTTWLFMPSINPDQLGVDRENSNNVDLNRDHLSLAQPEVRAIHAVIRDYQPHVLIDQHEDGSIVTSEVHFARAHNPQVPASIRTHGAALKTAAENAITAAGYTPQTYATSTDTRLLRTVGGLRYAITLLSEVRRPGTNIEGAVQRVSQQRLVLDAVLAYHAANRDDIASERAAAIAAKITEGATQSAAFQITDSTAINPPPIAYQLTSGQRSTAAHQFDLWDLDEASDGAGGVYVFMGQQAQPLIPFAFDSRADYEVLSATAHTDLSTTGEADVTAPAAEASASGTATIVGAVDAQAPAGAASASGTSTVTGTAAVEAPAASTAASGAPVVTGSAAAEAAPAQVSASDDQDVTGQVVATAPAAQADAAGAPVISGAADTQAAAATASASGAAQVTGQAGASAPAAEAGAAGTPVITGTADAQAPAARVAASDATDGTTGTADAVAPAATVSAAGTSTVVGAADVEASAGRTQAAGMSTITGSADVTAPAALVDAAEIPPVIPAAILLGGPITQRRITVGPITQRGQQAS